MTPIRVVVTANAQLWEEYGQRAIASWLKLWPAAGVELLLYAEDFTPEQLLWEDGRVTIREMPAWHTAWKAKHQDNRDAHGRGRSAAGTRNGQYDFRRDCVRFSHKVAALTDAAKQSPCDGILIMMDADVITHKPVDVAWLESLLPDDHSMAWLDRPGIYPECGFVMFREYARHHRSLMEMLAIIYSSDAVFQMSQTHDSYVLMKTVQSSVSRRQMPAPFNLTRRGADSGHPFVSSRLAERLDHLKGKRKAGERSPEATDRRS